MSIPDQVPGNKLPHDYTPAELITCVAARLLEDNRSVLVGTGLPMLASMLAQRSHAPNLLLVFEAGGIGPRIPELPVSVGDSVHFSGSCCHLHARCHVSLPGRLYRFWISRRSGSGRLWQYQYDGDR